MTLFIVQVSAPCFANGLINVTDFHFSALSTHLQYTLLEIFLSLVHNI